jgi:hypothetical protein
MGTPPSSSKRLRAVGTRTQRGLMDPQSTLPTVPYIWLFIRQQCHILYVLGSLSVADSTVTVEFWCTLFFFSLPEG